MAENKTDNITLGDIKIYAAKLKSFYLALLLFCMNALKRYWYLLLVGIVIGCGLGYNKFRKFRPYFEGKATFTFTDFNKKMYGEMTDKLRGLVQSGSYKTLSEKLEMSESDTRKIADIEAINIAGSPLSDDITESKQPFYIRVKLTDREIADTLLTRIERYLNNSPQAKSMIQNNMWKMQERLVYTSAQIQKLDSLKTTYQFYLAHQNIQSGSVINTFNPVELYTATEKLIITKTDLERGIINYKVVKVLDPFVLNDFPSSASLSPLLMRYALAGLILAVFAGLLIHAFKLV
ncbi:MAG TPA: hypothetical protein PKC54_07190 [Ferruginibacter sp.]|nr:hypothetical protein [Ferruginibacter sp.]